MTHIFDSTAADFQAPFNARWNLLSEFVAETCKGRDESHGYAHMKAVAETSKFIIKQDWVYEDETGSLMLDAITVAWLHDIADHKYDHDGTLEQRLDAFGTANISNYNEIKHVIKYVSYSTENKAILAGTPLNFPAILGAYYSQIRDIVSDADKLEAIGIVGIQRCIEYTTHTNPTYTQAQVMSDVKKHADEKLLRLASQFIKTPTARTIAIIRHNEMDEWLQAHTIPLPPTPSTGRPYMFGDD
jgi:HD superfamily phosphodiesterase